MEDDLVEMDPGYINMRDCVCLYFFEIYSEQQDMSSNYKRKDSPLNIVIVEQIMKSGHETF